MWGSWPPADTRELACVCLTDVRHVGGIKMVERRDRVVALFGTDPLEELLVPDGTHVQEHDLVTDGDVIVASQSTVEFGVRGGNVIAGRRCRVRR